MEDDNAKKRGAEGVDSTESAESAVNFDCAETLEAPIKPTLTTYSWMVSHWNILADSNFKVVR